MLSSGFTFNKIIYPHYDHLILNSLNSAAVQQSKHLEYIQPAKLHIKERQKFIVKELHDFTAACIQKKYIQILEEKKIQQLITDYDHNCSELAEKYHHVKTILENSECYKYLQGVIDKYGATAIKDILAKHAGQRVQDGSSADISNLLENIAEKYGTDTFREYYQSTEELFNLKKIILEVMATTMNVSQLDEDTKKYVSCLLETGPNEYCKRLERLLNEEEYSSFNQYISKEIMNKFALADIQEVPNEVPTVQVVPQAQSEAKKIEEKRFSFFKFFAKKPKALWILERRVQLNSYMVIKIYDENVVKSGQLT